MTDLTPRLPNRPLLWPDVVYDLQELLSDVSMPVQIVGGAVRDAYLHRPIKDLDLVTPTDSIKLARRIADLLRGDVFVLDSERGVARVLFDTTEGRLTLDIARYRGGDLWADLLDRDFTINAMAVDIHGDLAALIDPLGGEADATGKLLRRCSPESIAHDPIRALRAVRQSVQLGMRIDPKTIKDIRSQGVRIAETSPERVRDELLNLLNVSKPASALRIVRMLGLLGIIMPEVENTSEERWQDALGTLEYLATFISAIGPGRTDQTAATFGPGILVMQLDRFRPQLFRHIEMTWANARHRALLMLMALLYTCGLTRQQVEIRAEGLRLSNPEKLRLITAASKTPLLFESVPDARQIYRFWRELGEAGIDVCLVGLAAYLGSARSQLKQEHWLVLVEQARVLLEAYYTRYETSIAAPPLLDGTTLMQALNLQPGRLVGQLLEVIREEQALGSLTSTDEAVNFAKARLNTGA